MPPESPYKSTLRPEDFAPRPGFKIGVISIIVYLAGIATHFFLYGGRERIQAGGPAMGLVIGSYVGIFLLAALISFVAFAFAPSRLAATVVFCLSVPALVFGAMQVNHLADLRMHPELAVKATPPPTPGAAPTVIPGNPTYSSGQRGRYINQATDAFTAARTAKIKALTDALKTLQAAGYILPAGLTSKEAIADRRKLIENGRLANEDYINFVTTQEATYRAELEKTPLVPNDVNNTIGQFHERNSHTTETLAVRTAERDLLKSADDTLALLDNTYGHWHLREGKAIFEKRSDSEPYGKLIDRFNATVAAQNAAQAKLTALQNANPEGAAAATSDAAASLAAVTAAGASPAPASTVVPAATAATAPTPVGNATPGSSAAPVITPVPTAAPTVGSTP